MKQYPGYTLVKQEDCPEQHGTLTVLTHDVSGASVLLVENDDNNKAFGIGFGTFPSDDTGVFHILEHSVLAGSEKYPVKSPFLQLLKSSMASFLNAMTFPDKTVYPFATPNETDFKNLMDVYLNAVFCPLAMVDKAVFEQEGWHRGEDGTVSGVVYNEMQGALASPDAQLQNALERAMFPDTAYGFVSGGDPASIPALTYEKYKRVYHRHYSADNCCITLYGNLNMGEALAFLDEAYLSRMPKGTSRPRLTMQDEQPGVQVKIPYYTEKPEADEVQCALAWYTGAFADRERQLGVEILLDALLGSNQAPLKAALLNEKLGADIDIGFDDSTLQPTLELVLRGATEDTAARFAAGGEEQLAGATLLHHPSAGSTYLNFYYDLGSLTPEEMQYLDLLTDVLDELDTPRHTARELNTLRGTWLGNSSVALSIWTGRQAGSPCHTKLTLSMSLLERSLEKAVELGGEWLYETRLTGPGAEAAYARVLSQQKLNMEQQFIQQGNSYAAVRAGAHFTVENALTERVSGVTAYHFLCELLEKADWAAVGAKFEALREKLLHHAQLTVSFHGSEAGLDTLRKLLPGSAFAETERGTACAYTEELTAPVNEAFIIDGGVNYDLLVWPMERCAARKVLARVMSYEYLWHHIREVGGAYGTGMLTQDGVEYLYTYRDPHLTESYDTFAKGPADLAARDYTEKDMNEFIVGTVAKLDTPRKPYAQAKELDRRYFCGITDGMAAADRAALCAVDADTLKAQAAALPRQMAKSVRVAFGSKDAVEAAKGLFDRVETL